MSVAALPRVQVNPAWALDPALVFYLPLRFLDGASFADRSVYGHACTKTGAIWTPQGHYLDGVNDQIDCGNPAALDITGQALTVMCWWNPAGTPKVGQSRLVYKGATTAAVAWALRHDNNEKPLLRTVTAGGDVSSTGNNLSHTTPYHLAGVYDGSFQHLIVNGEIIDSDAQTGNLTSQNTLTLGSAGATARPAWGVMDDVRIYNRVLTLAEIQRISHETKGRYT